MKKLALLIVISLAMGGSLSAQDFNQSYNFINTGTNGPTTTFANTGVASFFISWFPQVSLSACSVQIDSSADGISWGSGDLIASTSCTAAGSSSTASLASGKNFVRVHVTVLTGNGGLNVTLKGWGGSSGGSSGISSVAVLPATCSVGQGFLLPNGTITYCGPQANQFGTGNPLTTGLVGIATFGTSLTNGFGDSNPQKNYANLTAVDLGGIYQNYAHNGDHVADGVQNFIIPFVQPAYTHNPIYTLEFGVNEGNVAGGHAYTTADQQANYQSIMTGAAAFLGIPHSNKVFGQSCTKTSGTWTNDTTTFAPATTYAVQSTTNGSVLTCSITTTGTTLYMGYRLIDGDGGTATVSVDGGANQTINGFGKNGSLISTLNGLTSAVGVFTATATPGAHTVTITVTSSTNASNLISIVWLGSSLRQGTADPSNNQAPSTSGPQVMILGVLKEQNDNNSALTATLNGINQTVANNLIADGMNVKFVDVRARVNPTGSTEMFDNLHPNDTGNLHMRDALENSLQLASINNGIGAPLSAGQFQSQYDNFNRANGAIGANWTVNSGGFNVTSNTIISTGAAIENAASWLTGVFSLNPFSTTQFSQVTITKLNGTTDFPGVGVLMSGSSLPTGYMCQESTTSIAIFKYIANVQTILTNPASTGNVGDRLLLTVDGSGNLTCYKNGVSTATAQDRQIQSGSPGIVNFGNVATMDNWSGGNINPIEQETVEADVLQGRHFLGGFNTQYDFQTAQTISLPAKTLYLVGANNTLFSANAAVGCTTTSASATVLVTILYTDVSNTPQTPASSTATCTTLGSASVASVNPTFMAKAGTVIQYSTTIANTPTYDVRVAINQLGAN